MKDRQSITQRTVREVANHTGKHPLELPPLGREIDVDALEDVGRLSADTTIQFTYAGHAVTVRGDEEVHISSPPHDTATT